MKANKAIKVLACSAAVLTLTVGGMTAVNASEEVFVTVNGEKIEFDVKPEIMDGRTMVPVRAIFEAVGAEVDWNDKTQTVTGTKDGTVVQMTIGSNKLLINGSTILMDCEPVKIDNRVLTPARYVVESYGYVVTWDDVGNTVKIMSMDDYKNEVDQAASKPVEKKSWFSSFIDWIKSLFS